MLRQRILTALILAAVLVLAVLWAPPAATAALFGVLLLVGAWEVAALHRPAMALPARILFVLMVSLCAGFAYRAAAPPEVFHRLLVATLAAWALATVWVVAAPGFAPRAAAWLYALMALVPTWIILVRINSKWPRGGQWTLYLMVLAIAADTGAFFAGRRFGRHRLAPQVSPGKTWEGVLGGLGLAAAVAIGGAYWFGEPAPWFILISVGAAALSVVGDLTESLLKRHAGMKDSGHLLPGHGGILDRIDSITACAPALAYGLILAGVGA